jgi:FkbM family methyltransferase
MSDFLRPLKDLRFRIFYGALLCRRHPLIELGSRNCPWILCPEGLDARSIVYSGGVGRDITFEHDLVKNYGCQVVLFDPSPTGLETMALPENKIPQFKHHAVALAGQCGTLKFTRPIYEDEGSWHKQQAGGVAALEVPCVDLATLMRQNGHDHIDLLKIDIEGAEYEVIDDLLKRRLPVKQVLVEFHHQLLPGVRRQQTVRAILKMAAAGYRLLKKDGENHTFLKPSR